MAGPRARTENRPTRGALARALKRGGIQIVSLALCAVLALGSLVGCAAADGERGADARPTLTVYMDISNYGIWFEKVRARFPDVDFQGYVIRSNDNAAELARRIEHGDTPDIILTNSLDRSVPSITENLMDLSGKEYTTAYMTSFLNASNIDGGIYYLPSQITTLGLAYDKTLFDERGWPVPDSFDSLIASCNTAAQAGMDPALVTFGKNYAADMFYRLLMLDVGYKLDGSAWLQRFNSQEAALSDVDLTAVFDDFEALAAAGVLNPADEAVSDRWYAYNGNSTRRIGYIESHGSYVGTVSGEKQGDSFEMIPYFGTANGEGYLFAVPQVFVAAGSQVEGTEKEALVDDVLEFVTSAEGQQSIMGITNSVVSPVLGVSDAIDDPFLARVSPLLAEERLLTLPTFNYSNDVLNDMLKKLVAGEVTRDEVIAAVDETNAAATVESIAAPEPTLANAAADFSYEQTTGVVLDAYRTQTDCDFALSFYTLEKDQGKLKACANGKLYEGPITETDVNCINAFYGTTVVEQVIDRVSMTGHQLLKALEYENALYYTGFDVCYVWNDERGTYKAADLLDADGNVLDPDATYIVAMSSDMDIGGTLFESRESTSVHAREALRGYLQECGTISPEQVHVNGIVEEKRQ